MFKKSGLITILSSLIISIALILGAIFVLTYLDIISFKRNTLVFTSESVTAEYNGQKLTADAWNMVEGELKEGHTLDVKVTGAQTNAGFSENYISVKVLDKFGADVTSEYNIECIPGTLTVNKRSVTVTANSAQKQYDGTPLTDSGFTFSPDNALAPGEALNASVTGSITEVGEISNRLDWVTITDQDGNDKSYNYDINYENGTLTVTKPGSGTGLGGGTEGGGLEIGAPGNVGAGFNIVYYEVYSDKTESVYLRTESLGDYLLTSWESAKEYTELMPDGSSAYYLTSRALENVGYNQNTMVIIPAATSQVALPYFTASSSIPLEISDVKFSPDAGSQYSVYYVSWDARGTAELPDALKEYEEAYRAFVYENYTYVDPETRSFMQQMIVDLGLNINSPTIISDVAKIIQSSASYNLEYDRSMDDTSNIVISFLRDYKEGICQHYAASATVLFRTLGIPARYTRGFVANTVAGQTVQVTGETAHAWVEVYLDGIGWISVEVTGSDASSWVKPADAEKQYDGTPLYAPGELVFSDDIDAAAYDIVFEITGELAELGIGKSLITYLRMTDKNTSEVVYDSDKGINLLGLKLRTGRMHLYIYELIFESTSKEQEYDARALENTLEELKELACPLSEGHYYLAAAKSSITNVGKVDSAYKITVYDAEGNDITSHYKITSNWGELTVSAKKISVKAKDASKVYDGEALTCNEIEYDQSMLIEGHRIASYEVIGSITMVGRVENILKSVQIIDENGNDVTGNYSIELLVGKLQITFK